MGITQASTNLIFGGMKKIRKKVFIAGFRDLIYGGVNLALVPIPPQRRLRKLKQEKTAFCHFV